MLTLVEAGTLRTKPKDDVGTRCRILWTDAMQTIHRAYVQHPQGRAAKLAVVIEEPYSVHVSQIKGVSGIVRLGMAFGALCGAAADRCVEHNLVVNPGTWTKGMPSSKKPGTKEADPHKMLRQEKACELYGVPGLGKKTTGGDVADALLIAWWAHGQLPSSTEVIVAFDPSISKTGFAIVNRSIKT